MKKIAILLLTALLLTALTSCGESEYPPIESTELESSVVMTLHIDNKEYNVKYELYRAFFLNVREEIDGGDTSVWSGKNKDEYISRADKIIKERISGIYSVFYIAEKVGIDVYSDEFDDIIEDYMEISVDGGYYDDIYVEGFDGDYDAYLASLSEMNLNYSVQDLLLRYQIASGRIFEYYAGYTSGEYLEDVVEGELKFTKEDVKAFYENRDECTRVIRATLPKEYFKAERAAEIRETICEKKVYGTEEVIKYVISLALPTATVDIENGEVIGRHNLDSMYYKELVDVAFDLEYFAVSEVIEISDAYSDTYTIVYKINKTDEHFEECYDSIKSVYIQNEIGKILDTAADSIYANAENTAFLNSLDRSTISMK